MAALDELRPVEATQRLDPFLLPPATTARFLLLTVLTLFGSTFAADWYAGGADNWGAGYDACIDSFDAYDATAVAADLITRAFQDCVGDVNVTRFGVAAGAIAGVATAILLVHALAPVTLVRRRALAAPPTELYPEAVAQVRALIAAAGLRRAPELLVDGLRERPTGRAFGAFGRYRLRLTASVLRGEDDASRARRVAIVRHELAHLQNRDVEVTGLAVAAGRVFAVLVAAPLAVLAVVRDSPQRTEVLWRVAVLTVLVILVRASVIRLREHYADVRASVGTDAADRLRADAFDAESARSNRVPRPLRQHPGFALRAAVVADPARLLRVGFVECAAVGLTVGLTLVHVTVVVDRLQGGGRSWSPLVGALLLALFAGPVLVAGLWRATVRALAAREPLPRAVAPGLGLGLGILVGEYLMGPFGARWATAVTLSGPVAAAHGVLLVLGCVAVARWAIGTATAWLPTARGRRLTPSLRLAQLVGAGLLGAVVGSWQLGLPLDRGVLVTSLTRAVIELLSDHLVLALVVAALALPVAAGLRRDGTRRPRGYLLDAPETVRLLPAPLLRPWAALLPGVVALGLGAATELLGGHGVLLRLANGVLARGQRGFVPAYAVLAVWLVAAVLIVLLVLARTWRRDGSGLPVAHATTATVGASLGMLISLLWLPQLLLCDGTAACPGAATAFVRTGIVAPLPVGIAVVIALLTVSAAAAPAVSLRRLAGRAPRWPAPDASEAGVVPLRCPRTAVAVATGFLVLFASLCTFGIAHALDPIHGDTTMYDAYYRDAPAPPPAGSVSASAACRQFAARTADNLDPTVSGHREFEVGRTAAGSDSAALRAFGTTLEQEYRRNGSASEVIVLARSAIASYCTRRPG